MRVESKNAVENQCSDQNYSQTHTRWSFFCPESKNLSEIDVDTHEIEIDHFSGQSPQPISPLRVKWHHRTITATTMIVMKFFHPTILFIWDYGSQLPCLKKPKTVERQFNRPTHEFQLRFGDLLKSNSSKPNWWEDVHLISQKFSLKKN